VSAARAADPARGEALLTLYDTALPDVYGYLLRRCGGPHEAEDLTAETFLAAAGELSKGRAPDMTLPWLIGIARHKLVDHWRRQARDERSARAVAGLPASINDPWEAHLDAAVARQVLAGLPTAHRAALTLRYVDDLPVPQVAALLGRSLHATESLLVRARAAFRDAYLATGGAQ
jgi:RNA polymerase sigma-70 factor (ECF subfamily)